MSGGAFEYKQHHIQDIAEQIEHLIYTNGSKELDEGEHEKYHNFPPDVIEHFKNAVRSLEEAYVYAQRVDWLISGDDGIGNFKIRLVEDLQQIRKA